jgi:hypothetical protein
MSKNEQDPELYSARLKGYVAKSIINWNVKTIGGKIFLSLIVLKEQVDVVGDDGFEWIAKTQFRVLKLNNDNIYVQEIWDESETILSSTIPLRQGVPFNFIPFIFIGAENNDPKVDPIPLYDLAVLTLGHYRNSADLEESGHVCGQIFLAIFADVGHDEFKAANPSGVQYGSRQGLYIPSGTGKAELLQANPNQLLSKMMEDKKDYAVSLGARLIAPPGGRETAEAARNRLASQNSTLHLISKNVQNAVEGLLRWVCDFMGGNQDLIEYRLNDQYYDETADPLVIAQEILMTQNNYMTVKEFRDNRRYDGTLDPYETDEGVDLQAHMTSPLAGADVPPQ